MRTFSRRFLALAVCAASLTLLIGCGDSETGGQKPADPNLKLKALPAPTSPADGAGGGKQPKGQPGGSPVAQ